MSSSQVSSSSSSSSHASSASTAKTKTVKQVVLTVRHEFEIPHALQKGSLEDVEEMLTIGVAVHQMTRMRRATLEIQKITEQKDAELARIHASYQEKLSTLRTEQERLHTEYEGRLKECQTAERDLVARDYEDRLRLLRKDNDILLARSEAMEASRKALEDAREKDITAAITRVEEAMDHVVRGKQEELDRMRGAQDKLAAVIQRQSEEIQKLSQTWGRRTANAKTKGTDYEDEFGAKLRRAYGVCRGFTLTDTRASAIGHAMDYSTIIDGHVVMWELKNYANTVPKTEVDKFLRDVRENAHCSIAVMISRTTDIYGKSAATVHPMHTEFEGERMLVYVSRFEDFCGDDDTRVFSMLLGLFRVWWEYHRTESKTMDRAELVHELHRMVEDMSRRRMEWRRHRGHLEEVTRWMTDHIEEQEMRLDRLLQRLQHDETSAATSSAASTETSSASSERLSVSVPSIGLSESSLVIPEEVFRESREEREMSWIQSIMRVCIPGGEIEVRELVERLSTQHKLSKDTIRSNVMSVIRDSAVYKRSVIKYIRGIQVAPM